MIHEYNARKFCKDDISRIENYELAITDTTQTWHIHHRDELRILPSGMKVYRSKEELIENGRYYHCPANELIFLTHSEHMRLHKKGDNNPSFGKHFSEETCRKLSELRKGENHPFYGRHHSEETLKKMSESRKGRTLSTEHRKKLSEALKGKSFSAEHRRKISEAAKRRFSNGNCYQDHEIEPEDD